MIDNTSEARPDPDSSPDAVPSTPTGWDWRGTSPIDAVSLGLVIATLGFAYAPNFLDLYRTWVREPDYSHGFLVLPIAAFILYRLWPIGEARQPRVWWPGLVFVAAALGLRYWFHERGSLWSETATLLPVVAGLALTRLGWSTMRAVWPAFAFLIFWLPLPPQLNSALSQPLQSIATKSACGVLRATGLWVMPEGNVILVGGEQLEVAAACNGLSMLMSLAAAVAATASIIPMATIQRLILLASIIPIALLSNVLRIAATAWCYYQFGAEVGSRYAHDAAGWLMMPTAMALVGLELLLWNWLVVETKVAVPKTFMTTLATPRPSTLGEAGS